MSKFNWRKWNNILHRDIGYLSVGLTVIFAISGIAVNHVEDWNPNYSISTKEISVNLPQNSSDQELIQSILKQVGTEAHVESTFMPSADLLQIFMDNETIEIDLTSGTGTHEKVRARPLLYEFNFLHLNHAKKWWTYFSDLYAIALAFLAISGIFVLKGRKGWHGRGKWLVSTGLAVPLFFLIIYRFLG